MSQSPEPSRLEVLRGLFARDPRDGFAGYGLAMELARKPATEEEALAVFHRLLETCPEYLPTYYQLGTLLARRGEETEARAVLEKGTALAAKVGDQHTQGELQAALDALP